MPSSRLSTQLITMLVILVMPLFPAGTRASAQTESVLYNFSSSNSQAGITFDTAGNIYGTQALNIFQLTPQAGGGWSGSTIYTFPTFEDTEGTLFRDAAGNLYAGNLGALSTNGFVFELSPGAGGSWTEQTLYTFPPTGVHGNSPYGDLIFDSAGNIYGTTFYGGAYAGTLTGGTVFELTPQAGGGWTEKLLHSFGNNTDGQEPYAGVIFDKAGNLYGTTSGGGTYSLGVAFELIPQANGNWKEKLLHTFGHSKDGQNPWAKLTIDSAGNLYGTAVAGGAYNLGTAFELAPQADGTWKETIIHSFGSASDGANPYSNLVFDGSGNLWGTTYGGGLYSAGTVFKLTPQAGGTWTETIVYNFALGSNGSGPLGDVVFDGSGNLYGTTLAGGANQEGTVWEVTP